MKYGRTKIRISGTFAPSIVFLAEGASELLFIDKVLQHLNVSVADCAVFLLEGYQQLEDKIRNIKKEPNFHAVCSLGVMLDADRYPDRRLRKTANALGLANFPSDENVLKNNRVCSRGQKKAGVFLSPGNGQRGRIENLVIDEIRTTEIFECLSNFGECTEGTSGQLDDKGLVQCYISARAGDRCGLGRAFEAGILDVNHNAYAGARRFVQNLL